MAGVEKVVWEDISGFDGAWYEPSEVLSAKTTIVTTVGQVVSDTPTHVILASSWTDDGNYGNINVIPMSCVLSREPLDI